MTDTLRCDAALAELFVLPGPDTAHHVDLENRPATNAWGTLQNAVHHAKAVHALHHAGLCYSAIPNLRSLLEYTMGTLWLAHDGENAVKVLTIGLHEEFDRLYRQLEEADSLTSEAAAVAERMRAMPREKHPDESLRSFYNLLRAYGFTKPGATYSFMSQLAHLSGNGIASFLDFTGDALTLREEPLIAEPFNCLRVATGMLFDAMTAFNALTTDQPLTDRLDEIGTRYGVVASPLLTRVPPQESTGNRRGRGRKR